MDLLSLPLKKTLRPILLLALICCVTGMLIGVLGSAFYARSGADKILGLSFQQIRPLHTGLVVCWIFLAGVGCIYYHLMTEYQLKSGSFIRFTRITFILWILAGIGFVGGIMGNNFTGREYISFNPIVSLLVLSGWLVLALNFFKTVNFRNGPLPIYIWMWGTSMVLFSWTFIEAHLYLIPLISQQPLYDMSIQWKSYGTLVGSFNLLVYGSIYFIGERLSGSKEKAHSRLAFTLFFIGILNSFTNYGHHTYHLPQSHYIKWVSFIVSMTEISIFGKVCLDLVRCGSSVREGKKHKTVTLFLVAGTIWTWIQLGGSILMSWPSLNSLVHGTHVVASHAMGTMIGIDSMLLWGVVFFLVAELYPERILRSDTVGIRRCVIGANLFLFVFWIGLAVKGLNFGWKRFTGTEFWFSEHIDQVFPMLFAVCGTGLTVMCLGFMLPLFTALLERPFALFGSAGAVRKIMPSKN